ncbi:phosphoesterase [Histoplasma capsulatum H143]|uniref:Phosphoesterase n=1 Tax=Ajellomyces capsulatus (strain H143) TaxID=544712 RepID=C6H2P6_AJECH|nr:phosphoesterase [Histoplasma capsulatum H143]
MVTRRIVRAGIQLGLLALIVLLLLFIFDNKLEFLPAAIHDHLPAHHPGLVVTDVTVTTCSSLNIFSSCTLDPEVWHRIEKDLYLGTGWTSSAYTHIQRKKEEDLLPTDSVVIDLKIGRLDPGAGTDKKWEARPAGIWLLRTDRSHTGDPQKVITSLDVLFGADAADPRTGWEVKDTPLLLDTKNEARLSIRRGPPAKLERPPPRIRKDGRFKIMQASDLHLSTGLGKCREPIPHLKDESKCEADPRTLEFLERMLDEEKPDLVIISGDQVNGDTAPDAATAIFKLADIFVKRRIPYAAIFGNHDDEGNLDRSQSMALLHNYRTLYQSWPSRCRWRGHYIVESDILILTPRSERLQKSHREYRYIHMNLAFIHIPFPEYRDRNSAFYGNWTEPSTAPRFNSGFRDALVSENVVVVSCGHDHVNDYCMLSRNEYSQPSLWMCYAGGAGFGGYGGYGGYIRRVRFFDINMNSARIMTYKRLEYGDTASKINEMMIVDGGKVVQSD